VRHLVIKVMNIVDVRCNHEVYEAIALACDTNAIFSIRITTDLTSLGDVVLFNVSKCFTANNLVLNLVETNVIKCIKIILHEVH